MKMAVVGSRGIKNYAFIKEKLTEIGLGVHLNEIVSGGAIGVDKLAERFARENNLLIKIFPADWKNLGKQAGYIRNKSIVEYSDLVVAIWDGKSPGTKHSIDLANKFKKPLHIFYYGRKKTNINNH